MNAMRFLIKKIFGSTSRFLILFSLSPALSLYCLVVLYYFSRFNCFVSFISRFLIRFSFSFCFHFGFVSVISRSSKTIALLSKAQTTQLLFSLTLSLLTSLKIFHSHRHLTSHARALPPLGVRRFFGVSGRCNESDSVEPRQPNIFFIKDPTIVFFSLSSLFALAAALRDARLLALNFGVPLLSASAMSST